MTKPRIRKRHGVWVCSSSAVMFAGLHPIMGHGYTPSDAWLDWVRQGGRTA